ncbi:MAG: L,D-transpeptidase [Paracoccaceae bacterium]
MIHKSPKDLVLTPSGLRFANRLYPCTIGKGALTQTKREGDGATPQGIHRIVGMLYRPDRVRSPAAWAHPILPGDLWCDDVQDPNYNKKIRAPHPARHEVLRRADPLYDLVLLTDWNWPEAIKGHGSAIFLHQWRRPGYPTEGCIALKRSHLHAIAKKLTLNSRVIVP